MDSSKIFALLFIISSISAAAAAPDVSESDCGFCSKPPPKTPKKPSPTLPVPPVTVPKLPVPPVTVPKLPIPPVTVPKLPIPPVAVPKLPVPPVAVPKLPLPPVGIPKLPLPPLPNLPLPLPPVVEPPKGKSCPPPPSKETCPIDTLKLGACVDLLGGLVHVVLGDPAVSECCPIISGLVELEAAACLCTTLKIKALNLKIYVPLALELLVTCGKTPPPGYTCSL
ncbi:Bifunctional inhibitor/lipid-transfer protein/seed storage 2S albumin superfamily protein [Perilla frutescens var. frutescens]|nr:Bifunctional inhibitor/lipid-transfer protein/seed storage 2S albumin superfamily protein [Perilla frutescens var. frutescens]